MHFWPGAKKLEKAQRYQMKFGNIPTKVAKNSQIFASWYFLSKTASIRPSLVKPNHHFNEILKYFFYENIIVMQVLQGNISKYYWKTQKSSLRLKKFDHIKNNQPTTTIFSRQAGLLNTWRKITTSGNTFGNKYNVFKNDSRICNF